MGTALIAAIFVVGFVGQFYFIFGRYPSAKQRYYPWWVATVSGLFALVPVAGEMSRSLLVVWLPAVALNGWFLAHSTRFCRNCGRMSLQAFGRQKYCSHCGTELAPKR